MKVTALAVALLGFCALDSAAASKTRLPCFSHECKCKKAIEGLDKIANWSEGKSPLDTSKLTRALSVSSNLLAGTTSCARAEPTEDGVMWQDKVVEKTRRLCWWYESVCPTLKKDVSLLQTTLEAGSAESELVGRVLAAAQQGEKEGKKIRANNFGWLENRRYYVGSDDHYEKSSFDANLAMVKMYEDGAQGGDAELGRLMYNRKTKQNVYVFDKQKFTIKAWDVAKTELNTDLAAGADSDDLLQRIKYTPTTGWNEDLTSLSTHIADAMTLSRQYNLRWTDRVPFVFEDVTEDGYFVAYLPGLDLQVEAGRSRSGKDEYHKIPSTVVKMRFNTA